MADIDVRQVRGGETSVFEVTVTDGGSESRHEVTLTESEVYRLGSGYESKESFVRTCFEFLLEREPKESILRSFDVAEIARYFPEFETEMLRRSAGN